MKRETNVPPSREEVEAEIIRAYEIVYGRIEVEKKIARRAKAVYDFIENFKQHVLLEDDQLLVIDKPAGVSTHTNPIHAIGIREIVRYMRSDDIQLGHRLDINTTGVQLLVKTPEAKAGIIEQFKNRETSGIRKFYTAFVHGHRPLPRPLRVPAVLHLMLQKTHFVQHGIEDNLEPDHVNSETIFHSTESYHLHGKPFSLAQIEILSGRQHQIRVVSSALGHTVVGDFDYGDQAGYAPRTLLHARKLIFCHPVSGERLEIAADLPEDFNKFKARLVRSE